MRQAAIRHREPTLGNHPYITLAELLRGRGFSVLARQGQDSGREHAGIIVSRQLSRRQVGELFRPSQN